MSLIAANRISYTINNKKLFHNLSFTIDAGSALHIKGGNGSGKSTLLRILLGITTPSKGKIELLKPNTKITYLGHKNAIKNYLTPIENLKLIFHQSSLESALDWFQRLGLSRVQDEISANLSFGQQKKLALIRVLAAPADLIVLDEPFVGLDDSSRNLLNKYLQESISKGSSLALTSHIRPEIISKELMLENFSND
tara:strand:+ start:1065 stop:1652 length:588 start_codon:yes stop_codon:yes gene_type:complete